VAELGEERTTKLKNQRVPKKLVFDGVCLKLLTDGNLMLGAEGEIRLNQFRNYLMARDFRR
jgi:hypothetical protein